MKNQCVECLYLAQKINNEVMRWCAKNAIFVEITETCDEFKRRID